MRQAPFRHAAATAAWLLAALGGGAVAAEPAAAPEPSFGDEWTFRTVDLFTGLETGRYAMRFLRRDAVTLSFERTDLRSGQPRIVRLSHDLGTCSSSKDIPTESCGSAFAFPLAVGKKHGFERLPAGEGWTDLDCAVEGHEKVTVPAGDFDAYRVECRGRWTYTGERDAIFRGRIVETHWYAPAVQARVKFVHRRHQPKGTLDIYTQTELVSFRRGDVVAAEARVEAARAAAAAAAMPAEFSAGGARFAGRYTRDADNAGYSGSGRVVWANGDAYDGTLVGGRRQGRGAFAWANGQRYDGDWKDDRPEGRGTLAFANGDRYEGDVVAGVPEGEGRMAYGSGDRYEGRFAAGVPHGAGRYAFASGDAYAGSYVNGAAEGDGVYTWKSGDRYEGRWKQGRKDGRGTFTWANGDRFEGLFADDQRGEGTLTRKAP